MSTARASHCEVYVDGILISEDASWTVESTTFGPTKLEVDSGSGKPKKSQIAAMAGGDDFDLEKTMDGFEPLLALANRLRHDLMDRGWTPEMAERTAADWTQVLFENQLGA